ncbi:MAG: orotidine-5'-phosphate decarboxylase [Synergistales bacterium]|nr:orotidine-5'-phosphate decarboxylase [Bacteroidales bacterium]MDY6394215.1 orotidine-5'-phosphate decarboxylase [Bacteroidales bacterium]MDY6402528.1 orotidine-5'-phosphate decarboxylase [Bacteroidales bacterium]MDY6434936.1 orotidine-5'-phosphate decarboxylase [Synergistales bacterium]MEE3412684.1 orotidine-5'-phosphate decarboxylase [Bacteroidales bacterium]
MTRQELISLINKKQSFLCVGLDSDIEKIPQHLLKEEDPVFEFNKKIIDSTLPYTVAYKPNLAFYESNGIKGLISLKKTMDYLKDKRNECLIIADAKRGDIGNTSKQYAKSMLSEDGDFNFDAITIAPYMGKDSVMPFLSYPNKWVILLALTSNEGAADFQYMEDKNGVQLFEKVLATAQQWETSKDNLMFVCGATKAEKFEDIRKIAPDHFLLVPGVGAQGGSLKEVCKYGMNKDCGLLVNSSRGIIFADKTEDFYKVAGEKARELQQEMKSYLEQR